MNKKIIAMFLLSPLFLLKNNCLAMDAEKCRELAAYHLGIAQAESAPGYSHGPVINPAVYHAQQAQRYSDMYRAMGGQPAPAAARPQGPDYFAEQAILHDRTTGIAQSEEAKKYHAEESSRYWKRYHREVR